MYGKQCGKDETEMKYRKEVQQKRDTSAFDQALLSGLDAHIASKRAEDLEIARMISGEAEYDESRRTWCGPVLSNEDRLAYYRSHGLDKCDDYPGGDSQFEADVLSGLYHNTHEDRDVAPKREDAYIIARLNDGRFQVDPNFGLHVWNFELEDAYYAAATRLGWTFRDA